MHMHEIIAHQLDHLRKVLGCTGIELPPEGFQVLETGTIRQDTPQHRAGDGWSTLAFAQDAARTGGHVTSIDLDVRTAASVLTREGVAEHVTLREGYSVDWLATMLAAGQRFDVILLDSENDAQLILHEFMIAKQLLRRPGMILVDDVVPGSDTVVKGKLLLPWIEQNMPNATTAWMRRDGGGVHSGVLSVIL
jgi:hypothetical protein